MYSVVGPPQQTAFEWNYDQWQPRENSHYYMQILLMFTKMCMCECVCVIERLMEPIRED